MGAAVASSEVLPQIFRREAAAVASSMASWGESCRHAGGEWLERLARFRRELYWCLWRCPDALFELADAVLTAPGPVASLPYLSLEPAFRRGHGMIYRALGCGGVDAGALRDLLVAARPRSLRPRALPGRLRPGSRRCAASSSRSLPGPFGPPD
jgi:hypothetical protein